MSGLRQAALVLHGLSDADRTWMLGQLSADQAGTVGKLLAELRELGIPSDPSLASQALGANQIGPIRTRPAAQSNDSADTIRAASAAQLQRVLEGESEGLVALLLAAGEWPWRDVYLAVQQPTHRRTLLEIMAARAAGPRLQAQVLDAVARRLRELCTISPTDTRAAKPGVLGQFGALVSPMLKRVRP